LADCPFCNLIYTFIMTKRKTAISSFRKYQVEIASEADWTSRELDTLFKSIELMAGVMKGPKNFKRHIAGVRFERNDTGSALGLAWRDRIQLSKSSAFSAWTVIHELAHVWDAKNGWRLSLALQKYTGGFTSRFLSSLKRFFLPSQWDAQAQAAGKTPGLYGRKPGCNRYGYFYGDIPSGSNWSFNRREDFAESVVMYCGWARKNELSKTAHGRIERYQLPNGSRDPVYGITDNWLDYARYFYPENGDYTNTKRWQFIDDIIQGRIEI
jgi:hypothetical protein